MKVNILIPMIILLITVSEISVIVSSYSQKVADQVVEVLMQYENEDYMHIAMRFGCSVEREFKLFNIALMLCPSNSVKELRLEGFNIVQNFDIKIDTVFNNIIPFNSSMFQQGSYLTIPMYWSWAMSRVSADITWSYLGEEGSDTIIAILDTGVDPTHPLLAGKVVAWIEFDDKGRPICSKPRDTHGHGTWVSSIAAGGDGRRYIFGVAPKTKIMAALVLPYGYGRAAQVLAGLEWALQPYDPCTNIQLNIKPDVVSMSFGAIGNYSNVFLPAIKKLIENGIVAVAAIGNGGPYISSNPGNIWGVIGVGATDQNNAVASFSSYEDVEWPNPPSDWPFKGGYPKLYRKPDVVAPGVDVPGAFPGELLAIGSGTSASTPIVAGIAAIVSAKLKAQGLKGTGLVEAVYNIITSTSTPLIHPGSGNGLVDAYLAVAKAKNIDVKVVDLSINPLTAEPLSNITLTITGIDLGTSIDVYISSVKVFSGILRSRYLTLQVPLTHSDGNTVITISRNGLIYGKTLVQVVPSLFIEKTCFWGRLCKVLISGIGIGDLVTMYLENNLVTLYTSNLRGSLNASFITPIAEEGVYRITIIDFSRPSIVLRAQIYIHPGKLFEPIIINNTAIIVKNQTYTIAINNTYILPIYVRTKDYYIANTTDFLDIYIYRGSIERVVIDKKSLELADVRILNITKTNDDLYRVWFKVGAVKIKEVDVVLNLTITFTNIAVPYILIIRVLKEDPYSLITNNITQLSNIVNENIDILNRLKREVDNLNKNLSITMNNISDLSSKVEGLAQEVKDNVKSLSRDLENLAQRFAFEQVIMLVVIILSIVAVSISIIAMLKK